MKKKIAFDFVLNIIASFLITGILQLIIYPVLSRCYSAEAYGKILTTMGILNMSAAALGNTLNNLRLILNKRYEEKGICGDFNIILTGTYLVSCLLAVIIAAFLKEMNPGYILFIILLLTACNTRYYLSAYFRVKINFRKVFILNIFVACGYAAGAFFADLAWQVPFIAGEVLGCLYLFRTTPYLKERVAATPEFDKTMKKYLILLVSTFLGNALTYIDRLFLYPMAGGDAVSVYTAASFCGKSVSLVIVPVASVLLGYYSQPKFIMNRKRFWIINGCAVLVSALAFLVILPAAPIVTGFLYPTLIEAAKQYLLIANLSSLLTITAVLTQPAILSFLNVKWQLFTQGGYFVIYIITSYVLFQKYGIFGFCVAALISNLSKLVMYYMIGHIRIGTKGEEYED